MVKSDRHKFIYLPPSKTATNSIRTVLMEQFYAERIHPFGHSFIVPPEFSDYFTFLSVRNPYTRIISMFNYRWEIPVRENDTPLYISSCLMTPTAQRVQRCRVRIDGILHLETLDEDFNKLPFVKSPVTIPHKNATTKLLIGLTPSAKDSIWRVYKRDFAEYSYDPDDCPLYQTWEECVDPGINAKTLIPYLDL